MASRRAVCGEVWAHNGRIEGSREASNAQLHSSGVIPSLALTCSSKETWGASGTFHCAMGGLSSSPSPTHLRHSFTGDKYIWQKGFFKFVRTHHCGDEDLTKKWTPQKKAQCVALFIETKSDTQMQRHFWIQYGREQPFDQLFGLGIHHLKKQTKAVLTLAVDKVSSRVKPQTEKHNLIADAVAETVVMSSLTDDVAISQADMTYDGV
ncbi:hypothetical protein AVEN_164007-1 [Araneus ventricosus]|uniref:Uncharacterized protein n=1 Tax=Araneus ventricosus TaxID=182803 RepID=A0A4Y2DAP2_ARAVE|nr:hypothetical protein AVEN_164007-1 [Araneus ventricosus]